MTLQRPAYLTNRQVSGLDDFIGGLGIAQPPRVSLNDGRFTLLDETGMMLSEPTLSIDAVIVGVNKNASRIFYDKSKPYDADKPEGPLCWSDNGVGPSKACVAPQAPSCASCPNAVWGSAIGQGGKGIPACATIKKLALLVGGQEGLFLLSVTPASLGHFKQYIGALAKMPASPEEIITRIKMENKELLFEAVDWVPESYMQFIEGVIKNDDAASIVNRHDEPRDPSEFKMLGAPTPKAVEEVAQAPKQGGAVNGLPAPAKRGPGRPPKAAPVTAFAAPQPAAAPSVPQQEVYTPQPTQLQSQPPQGFGFGMQSQPQAPDPGVEAMLNRAFNLPRRT